MYIKICFGLGILLSLNVTLHSAIVGSPFLTAQNIEFLFRSLGLRTFFFYIIIGFINAFSKHPPSRPMLSISQNVRLSVCVSVHF